MNALKQRMATLSITVFMASVTSGTVQYVTRNANAQCYVEATPFEGDLYHNPLWGGGTMTLADCLEQCELNSDSNGRPCVAVEWGDGGDVHSESTTKSCQFCWGCDYTEYWSGGSVFTKDEYATWNANAQCFVEATQFEGDVDHNPLWWGGTMTLAECKSQCASSTDSNGRPCVAIEWGDGGVVQSDSTEKSCAFAWGCDYTEYWSGGSVFVQRVTLLQWLANVEYCVNKQLEWKGWTPTETLSECQGDCDYDDQCASGLRCVHDQIPTGCSGTMFNSGADYCGDESANVDAGADIEVDPDFSSARSGDGWTQLVFGAVIGAAALMVVAALFIALKQWKKCVQRKKEVTAGQSKPVHVSAVSASVDIDDAGNFGIETGMQ